MIYIWVRATVDWEDEEAFLAQVRPEFEPRLEIWNATFTIHYHLFRHRVRRIAQLNLSRVVDAVCAGWDEIPDGALVLPVDDDDWFSPNVGGVLEGALDPRATGYYWPSSWIEVPTHLGHRVHLIRRRILPWAPPKFICTTNNYAMVKGPGIEPLLRSHVRASEWFRSAEAGVVKRLEERLSIANRTLGSQTSLRHARPQIARSELLRKFRRYKKLYDRLKPHEPAWCQPYVAMMSELMGELQLKDRR